MRSQILDSSTKKYSQTLLSGGEAMPRLRSSASTTQATSPACCPLSFSRSGVGRNLMRRAICLMASGLRVQSSISATMSSLLTSCWVSSWAGSSSAQPNSFMEPSSLLSISISEQMMLSDPRCSNCPPSSSMGCDSSMIFSEKLISSSSLMSSMDSMQPSSCSSSLIASPLSSCTDSLGSTSRPFREGKMMASLRNSLLSISSLNSMNFSTMMRLTSAGLAVLLVQSASTALQSLMLMRSSWRELRRSCLASLGFLPLVVRARGAVAACSTCARSGLQVVVSCCLDLAVQFSRLLRSVSMFSLLCSALCLWEQQCLRMCSSLASLRRSRALPLAQVRSREVSSSSQTWVVEKAECALRMYWSQVLMSSMLNSRSYSLSTFSQGSLAFLTNLQKRKRLHSEYCWTKVIAFVRCTYSLSFFVISLFSSPSSRRRTVSSYSRLQLMVWSGESWIKPALVLMRVVQNSQKSGRQSLRVRKTKSRKESGVLLMVRRWASRKGSISGLLRQEMQRILKMPQSFSAYSASRVHTSQYFSTFRISPSSAQPTSSPTSTLAAARPSRATLPTSAAISCLFLPRTAWLRSMYFSKLRPVRQQMLQRWRLLLTQTASLLWRLMAPRLMALHSSSNSSRLISSCSAAILSASILMGSLLTPLRSTLRRRRFLARLMSLFIRRSESLPWVMRFRLPQTSILSISRSRGAMAMCSVTILRVREARQSMQMALASSSLKIFSTPTVREGQLRRQKRLMNMLSVQAVSMQESAWSWRANRPQSGFSARLGAQSCVSSPMLLQLVMNSSKSTRMWPAMTVLNCSAGSAVARWQNLMMRQRWQLRMRTRLKISSNSTSSSPSSCAPCTPRFPSLPSRPSYSSFSIATMKCSSQSLSIAQISSMLPRSSPSSCFDTPLRPSPSSTPSTSGTSTLLSRHLMWLLILSLNTPIPSFSPPASRFTSAVSAVAFVSMCLAHSLLTSTSQRKPSGESTIFLRQEASMLRQSSICLQMSSWGLAGANLRERRVGRRASSSSTTFWLWLTFPMRLNSLAIERKPFSWMQLVRMKHPLSSSTTYKLRTSSPLRPSILRMTARLSASRKGRLSLEATSMILRAAWSQMILISLMFFWEFSLSLSNTQQARLRMNSSLRSRCSASSFSMFTSRNTDAHSRRSSRQYLLQKSGETVSRACVSSRECSVTSLKMNLRVSMGISSQMRESRESSDSSGCQGARKAKGVQQLSPNSRVCMERWELKMRQMFWMLSKSSPSLKPRTAKQACLAAAPHSPSRHLVSSLRSVICAQISSWKLWSILEARHSRQDSWEWMISRSEFSSQPPQKQSSATCAKKLSQSSSPCSSEHSWQQISLYTDLWHSRFFDWKRRLSSSSWVAGGRSIASQEVSEQRTVMNWLKQRKRMVVFSCVGLALRMAAISASVLRGITSVNSCTYLPRFSRMKVSPYSTSQSFWVLISSVVR